MGMAAVIGAGIAGLVAAQALARSGRRVIVFEKSRGVGGRVATRRADPGLLFNHGLQYLRAASREFADQLREWSARGIVREWTGAMVRLTSSGQVIPVQTPFQRYVSEPGMTTIAKHLAGGLLVRTEHPIHRMERRSDQWWLMDSRSGDEGPFDQVVLAIPAPQAVALLGADDPLAERLSSVTMTPLWALMVAPNRASGHAFDAARIDGSPFTWMMRTPRDAGQPECWTFHLSPEWSRRHLELEPAQVMDELRPEAARLLNNDELRHIDAHRWRHALAGSPLGEPCLSDPARNLIIVGDWCLGDRVEHAWLSGKSVESDL